MSEHDAESEVNPEETPTDVKPEKVEDGETVVENDNIGEYLDALGVEFPLDEDELIEHVVVLMKIIPPEGEPYLGIATSDNISRIDTLGLMAAGDEQIKNLGQFTIILGDDDEDEDDE